MSQLDLLSPAKINLFLHVVGRRADGYHLLQTVFQFLDFCDNLVFKLRSDNQINLFAPSLNIPIANNLITRAAYLLQSTTQCNQGVDILLKKKQIPLGAGLGGGSSNAATTLLALNKLWDTRMAVNELKDLGLQLGADVPIFIHGRAAFAQGIGEKFEPIEPAENWILLTFPNCQIETAKIFSDSQLTRNTREITIPEFFDKGGQNDCEPIARKHYPQVAKALDCLGKYSTARMTGTGSCVFSAFNKKEAALEVAKKIPASLNAIIVKGLNYSPLHNAITNNFGVSPSGKAQGFDPCIPRFES